MNERRDIPDGEGGPQPSTATSRSLLDRVKAADAAAWERLVGLYAPLVFRWCRRWDLQEQDVADVFQEVFQAVVAHIGQFRKERPGDTFRGWLWKITRNKVHDHFRRLEREAPGVGGSDAQQRLARLPEALPPDDEPPAAETEDRDLFCRALDLIRGEFQERTWQAFWRTAVDGQAARDVAADLAMSPGAVRVAKSRVLHRLREELGDLMD
jgi:RNA polymerase sigma-70 factor (ECF subfamily)